jgi:hypothetical protein
VEVLGVEAHDDHESRPLLGEPDPKPALGLDDLGREHPDRVEGTVARRFATQEVVRPQVVKEQVDVLVLPAVEGNLLAGLLRDPDPARAPARPDDGEEGEDVGARGILIELLAQISVSASVVARRRCRERVLRVSVLVACHAPLSAALEGGLANPFPHEPGGWFRSVAHDPARGQLWAWGGDTYLLAIDPSAHTYGAYPAPGISGAAVAGDSLVIVGAPGVPHVAALP